MNRYYRSFFRCIAYNTAESLIYHSLLLAHQLILFKVTTYAQYGSFGSLFAIIYLIVAIVNLGLDASLGPFFYKWSQSRQHFLHFMLPNLLPNSIVLTILLCGLFLAKQSLSTLIIHTGCNETYWVIIAAGIILFESIKKTAKLLLQIVLKVQATALAEIGTIVGYTASVWGFYALGYTINGYLIFIPMLIVSILSSLFLIYTVYKWYHSLDDQEKTLGRPRYTRIIKSRLFSYINEMSNVLFSSNFLVPFFALHFNLYTASTLKLTSNVLFNLTAVLHKIFGTSSTVLLASLKTSSLNTKKHAFHFITQNLSPVLYSIMIFLVINGNKLFNQGNLQTDFVIIPLYCIMGLVENFAIIYEKFLLIQEQADYICVINILSIIGMILILQSPYSISLFYILLFLTGIRILSLIAISIVSFYFWRILPTWHIRPNYLIASMLFALLFFFIAR